MSRRQAHARRRHLAPIAGVLALGLAWPTGTVAHPHVWVSGGADFGINAEGELDRLHITWIYDPFASLYLVNYLNVDQDRDQILTLEDKEKILADQTTWPDTFQGDSYLFVDGQRRALGKPLNADTRILASGEVEVTFERAVLEPFRPGVDGSPVVVKVYDPTFYYAYEVEGAAKIIGPDGHGCISEHDPVDTSDPYLTVLAVQLSALGRNETPEQPDVGALFADELRLICG